MATGPAPHSVLDVATIAPTRECAAGTVQRVFVDATAAETYAAIWAADLLRMPLARALSARGLSAEAIDLMTASASAHPNDARPVEQLAGILADLGEIDRLKPLTDQLQRQWPDRPATPYYAATIQLLTGRAAEAVRVAEPAVQKHPRDARLRNVLGIAYASTGRRDEGRRALEAALELDARDASTYTNLAIVDLETGQPEHAVSRLGEALLLDPESPRALGALATALERLGHAERAARVRRAIK